MTDRENDSYYHIYDNRVIPSFVTDLNSEFADILFHNPSTICNEQALNSIIVKPAQSETIRLTNVKKDQIYRIEGFAYSGGGQEVQRVEVSLDGGENWLYCVRRVRNDYGHLPYLRLTLSCSILKHHCGTEGNFGHGCFGTLMSAFHECWRPKALPCVVLM